MIQKYAMAEILKCQSGIDLTEGPDTSKHIKTCSTGGAGNLNSNVWAQYFINVFESKISNPYKTTPSNPDGLLNSGPTRNAGEMVDKLTIQYNRSRQAAITKELIEIISGAESL